ncbi:MAG: GNAT family N-acetyltransferase [Opitutaceae bacterium]|nr:GNAT family N-acetyltransferase [Opitutaceae bacterium]
MTTPPTARSVLCATLDDRDRMTAALTTAFASDPVLRWLFPDALQYLTFAPQVLKHFAGRGFEHGSAYRSADFAGAALWLPPGVGPDEQALGAVMAQGVDSERHGEAFGVLEQVGAGHPDETHWYLPAIGVDSRRQGQGYGSALLARGLEVCDRAHVAAYLETSNPTNIPFYQRFGYEIIGEIQAGSSPVISRMFRAAR